MTDRKSSPQTDEFVAEVFPAELEEISARRAALAGEKTGKWPSAEAPSAKNKLVGLALSGGGIRSATFNLGVVQALCKHGLLKFVDYLSTVSGGGYIGSCLSCLLNRPEAGTVWPRFPFRHEHGDDETPEMKHLRNSGNYLAPGGLIDLLRIPMILLRGAVINLLAILPYVVLLVWLTSLFVDKSVTAAQFDFSNWYRITGAVGLVYLIWLLAFPLVNRFFRRSFTLRDSYGRTFGMGLLLLLVVAAIESLPVGLIYYHDFVTDQTWVGTFTVSSLFAYLFSGQAAKWTSKLRGKIGVSLLGLLGPVVLVLIYLQIGVWAVYGRPTALLSVFTPGQFYLLSAGIFLFSILFVNVNETSVHSFYRDRLSKAYLFHCDAAGTAVPDDGLRLTELCSAGGHAPYHLVNTTLNLQDSDDPNLRGRKADFFIFSKRFTGGPRTGYIATSEMERADPHLDFGTAMAISGAAAAPNMGTSTQKILVFIMALLNVRLGYWLPNPHFRKAGAGKKWAQRLGVGPVYLVRELFSRINEKSAYVNLSDGGHLENLGIYELLRRRCKYIIACDSEADPQMNFGGLAKLIRYARIDLGIEIDIRLDDLRRDETGRSHSHFALGRVHYRNGEQGWLLYVKASLTGDENEYIKEYQTRKQTFPHETTADQFFDEEQFEAYRSLGYHIANRLLKQPGLQPSLEQGAFEKVFSSLETQVRSGGK